MPWQQFESEGYAGSALNRLGGFVKLLGRGASYSDSFEAVSTAESNYSAFPPAE